MHLRMVSIGVVSLVLTAVPTLAGNDGDVSFYKDVLPIVQENCQTCHRPAGYNISGLRAPMSFMSYEEVRPWARSIAHKVETREMPPWFASEPRDVFENERLLTDDEIATIKDWVEAGAPAGDKADAPPPHVFAEQTNDGWSHGIPDFVVALPEPYVVEDDAYDINVELDVPLTNDILSKDVWVRGWELNTGAEGSGVHHMCAFVQPKDGEVVRGSSKSGVPLGGLLSCVAEGAESGMLPDGYAMRLKPGSTLQFNMHFNKEPGPGTAFTSQPKIGFFVENRPVKHEVISDTLANNGFEIPPNHPNYRIGMARTLKKDTLVLNYWPHGHFRAVAARYTAFYPDGREEVLLDVPKYDQSWQLTYKYKEPKLLPKGTRIEASFWYDNTAERGARRGFDNERGVGFGPRTNDEMSMGFISYVELDDGDTATNQN